MMIYTIAAKGVAIAHFAFIVFVIAGGLLVLKWPRLAWIHVPAAVWGILIEFFGWYCPMTTWENTLLRRAGQAGYSNGFIEHYLFALIYPQGLTRSMQIGIGVVVIVVNLIVYARLIQRS